MFFFADDLMLFAKADRKNVKLLLKYWIISATLLGKLILPNQRFCFLLMYLAGGGEAFVEGWGLSKPTT